MPDPRPKLRFRAKIQIRGINPYVSVSARQAARLKPNWRKPMPVRIQVNGKPADPRRINLMPAGDGGFFLYLHGQIRMASGTSVGDEINVAVEFDEDYRGGPIGPMPPWFGDELQKNSAAQRGWRSLSPSRQKEMLRYLLQLKTPQAQQRNVQKALHVLACAKARFMAKSWNTGDRH
jgi:hypothetical protein